MYELVSHVFPDYERLQNRIMDIRSDEAIAAVKAAGLLALTIGIGNRASSLAEAHETVPAIIDGVGSAAMFCKAFCYMRAAKQHQYYALAIEAEHAPR